MNSDTPAQPPAQGDAPIYLEEDYPELLRDVAMLVDRELRAVGTEPAYAQAVAVTISEHVREHYGGVPQYWPKGRSLIQRRRRAQMWEAFNGTNHAALARRFGMCVQQVYRNLAIAKAEATARTQHDLFSL